MVKVCVYLYHQCVQHWLPLWIGWIQPKVGVWIKWPIFLRNKLIWIESANRLELLVGMLYCILIRDVWTVDTSACSHRSSEYFGSADWQWIFCAKKLWTLTDCGSKMSYCCGRISLIKIRGLIRTQSFGIHTSLILIWLLSVHNNDNNWYVARDQVLQWSLFGLIKSVWFYTS